MLSANNDGNPARFAYLNVTPSLAQVLGVHAIAGRLFTAADEKRGSAPVIVISERVARIRFGSSGAAVDKTLSLDGKIYRVVGVLPDALAFPSSYPAAGWVSFPPQAPGLVGNIGFGLHAIVRSHPGLSGAAIRTALSRAYTQALLGYNSGMRTFIEQMQLAPRVETLAQREYGPVTAQLQLIELASLLLLLLVFANLAGLATSDALARRHELATRVALGGGTWRLFLERAHELALLGVVGWGTGVGLGWLGARALAAVIGQTGPAVAFSIPVLLLTLAAVLVVTTLLAAGGIWRLRTPRVLCADLMTGGLCNQRPRACAHLARIHRAATRHKRGTPGHGRTFACERVWIDARRSRFYAGTAYIFPHCIAGWRRKSDRRPIQGLCRERERLRSWFPRSAEQT